MKIQFEAEVKEVKASKVASQDKEMRLILITDSEEVLKLQSVIAKDTVKVSVEYE